MSERKKLELQLNQPTRIELLFDEPMVGESKFGAYYLYAVRNGDGATEYSFFAPDEVHQKLKELRKGSKAVVTKLAEQKGTKILTKYDVQVEETKQPLKLHQPSAIIPQTSDGFYEMMLQSCKDAVRIQTDLGGLMDPKSLAVTLFIARSKVSGG